MFLSSQNDNRYGGKPRKRKQQKAKIDYPAVKIPTIPPTVSEPEMTGTMTFYTYNTFISPGATMGQGRPISAATQRVEQNVSTPEIDEITKKYVH